MSIKNTWGRIIERQRYWQTVPLTGRVWIGFTAFLIFNTVGLTNDIESALRLPLWWVLIRTASISIVFGVGMLVVLRNRKLVLLLMPLLFVLIFSLARIEHGFPANTVLAAPAFAYVRQRLAIDGVLLSLSALAGWGLLIFFAGTQGVRHVRERTELELAERLQQTLAPSLSVRNKWYEVSGNSFPSSQMGGDLLDAVEDGEEMACYIGDVAGHGIQAGVFMGMIKSSARTALLRPGSLQELLSDLNNVLVGVKAGLSTYVTFACLRCRENGNVEYALAGHLPILHYRARSKSVSQLAMEQFPLGLFANATFDSGSVKLERGDLLVLLTDGLPEVTDRKDQQFGLDRVSEIVAGHGAGPLEDLIEILLTAVRQYGRQDDDQTLVLVRAIGTNVDS